MPTSQNNIAHPATAQTHAQSTIPALMVMIAGLMLALIPAQAQSAQAPSAQAQSATKQEKTIKLCGSEGGSIHRMFGDVVRRAYKHIGYRVEFIMVPNTRSLILANEGVCQGEILRVAKVEQKYPNLRLVPVPITTLEAFAFTINATAPIKTWSDFKNLRTYIRNGSVYAEDGTRGMDVGKVKTTSQMFQMLHDGKIDVAIEIHELGMVTAARDFPASKIHPIGAPLASLPRYHLVHRDSVHLIPLLEQAFTQMTASGEIEMLKNKAIQRMIEAP